MSRNCLPVTEFLYFLRNQHNYQRKVFYNRFCQNVAQFLYFRSKIWFSLQIDMMIHSSWAHPVMIFFTLLIKIELNLRNFMQLMHNGQLRHLYDTSERDIGVNWINNRCFDVTTIIFVKNFPVLIKVYHKNTIPCGILFT